MQTCSHAFAFAARTFVPRIKTPVRIKFAYHRLSWLSSSSLDLNTTNWTKQSAARMPRDPNTLSNYDEVRTRHVVANLEIDFERKILHGNVLLTLKSLKDHLDHVVLDTR
jgi:hypothetical protein